MVLGFGTQAALDVGYKRDISKRIPPIPRSPGTHIVGPWVIDSINLYKDLRTGTQYMGNWASRVLLQG